VKEGGEKRKVGAAQPVQIRSAHALTPLPARHFAEYFDDCPMFGSIWRRRDPGKESPERVTQILVGYSFGYKRRPAPKLG
jgi:hypothetical protein